MKQRDSISQLVHSRESDFLKFINSRISKNLKTQITAEEILSETVRYALEHPDMIENREEEDLFLFLLWKAKLLVCDKVRRLEAVGESKQPARIEFSLQEAERSTMPSPTLQLHREDKKTALLRYLDMLPNVDQRTVLRLVRLDGHSIEDVSKMMGRSPDAIKKLMRRAFENLVWKARSSGARKFATTGETT